MTRKVVNLAIPATVAGATSARTVIPTPDDSVPRTVIGVKASVTTKGIRLHFDNNSQDAVVAEASTLAQLTAPMVCSYVVAINVQISFTVENTTGGNLAAGDFVTVVYEV